MSMSLTNEAFWLPLAGLVWVGTGFGSTTLKSGWEVYTRLMAGHKKAEKAASELLEECWDGTLPIDPVRIAKSLGVEVLDAYLKPEVSGALVKKQGKDPSILLNAKD